MEDTFQRGTPLTDGEAIEGETPSTIINFLK
jgi:hypothetical protein